VKRRVISFTGATIAVGLLAGCVSVFAPAQEQAGAPSIAPVKAVYHRTGGLDEAQRAMGNIRNHLAADPNTEIVVVGNGLGIDFMLDGAKDRNGNPFEATIQELKPRGVDFRLCNNTLVTRKIDRSKVIPEAAVAPSGVAEVARLQAREGFVYLRP
jgi:uncharacterized protein